MAHKEGHEESWWEKWGGSIGGLLGAGAGSALAEQAYSTLGKTGAEGLKQFAGYIQDPVTGRYSGGLADELSNRLTFEPYTVTTATGSNFGMSQQPDTVAADGTVIPGGMNYLSTLSPDELAFQDAQLRRAESFFGDASQSLGDTVLEDGTVVQGRESQVFDRMMSAMAPERERARLDLEQRLANQGRLGVRTGMFGGTSEGLELAKAEEEARNKAILSAMEIAGNEQDRQARLGAGMLSSSYIPQAQMIGAIAPGMTASERRRQAISEATGAYGETYASGLDALLQSGIGQANIAGNLGASLATSSMSGLLSGLFS